MSRIGKAPVAIPAGVTVTLGDGIQVKGPKGTLRRPVVQHVDVAVVGSEVVVTRKGDSRPARSNHGLMRALIRNMVQGVTTGFKKELEVIGTGYRAEVRGRNLLLNLGYSHQVEFAIPTGIDVAVDKANVIAVSGIDRELVGQVAANIRDNRKPDRYKGKGVRYKGEYILIKAGKTA